MSKVLCMEIGQNIVRVAEVKKSGKHVTVLSTAVFETADDLTKDGKVRVSEEVITQIKEGLDSADLSASEIYFVVDSTRILYKTVEIPAVSSRQIESTLELSFSDMFPVDESLYHLTYINKGMVKKGEQKMLSLEVFAVPNDLSESYYNLAVSLRLSPKGLVDATHSIATLLSDSFKNRNVASISIGEVSSAVSVLTDGKVVFSKSIPIGVNGAISVVSKSHMTLDDIGNVGALELLYTQNVLLNQIPKSMAAAQSDEDALRYDATTSLSGLIAAIETNLTQFLQKENIQIQDVYLSGLGSGIAGISKLFAFEFGAPVTVVQQDSKLTIDKKVADDVLLLSCYTAIGAAIDNSNLFTKAERAGGDIVRRKQIDRIFMLTGIVCLAAGITFGVYSIMSANSERAAAQEENKKMTNHIQELQSLGVEQQYDEYALAISYNEEVKAIYEETKTGNEDMTDFLKELESIFPASSVVTNINMTPSQANLTVMCEDKYVAAGVLHLMRNMQSIKSMQCSAVGEDDDGNIVFNVSFELKSTLERHGLIDENGNPIEDDENPDEPDLPDDPDHPTDPDEPDNPDTPPTTTYLYMTYDINSQSQDLGKFTINGVQFDFVNLTSDQFVATGYQRDEEATSPSQIPYGDDVVVPIGNPLVFKTGEEQEINVVLGTLDETKVYAVQINSTKEDAFEIEALGLKGYMTLEDAANALTDYEPNVLEDGTTEYLIKSAGYTLKLTFSPAEVIPESGTQVYRLNSITIVANAIADMMF